jgi:hypothetical protein
MPNEIEKDYEALVRSLYDKLREDVDLGEVSATRAAELSDMILVRTGVSDSNPKAWDNSSWCAYGDDDDGWNDSGCSF